jgi:hypothetical protein
LSVFGQSSPQKIVLNDNTVLVGRVLELKDGIYTIETETLGSIKIDAGKILEISSLSRAAAPQTREIGIIDGARSSSPRPGSAGASVPAGSDLARQQEEVNSRVKSMTMSGDFLDSMMNLSESSTMLDIMQDPEIMEAISNNDYEYLMNSDKMKNLMESQEIRDLLGDIQP